MQCSSGRYLRGVVSLTLRPLLRGGSRLVSLPNSPNYAVFQRPFLQFHQLIDLTGAQKQSCSVPADVTSRGAVSPNFHTLRPLLRGGSGLVSLPNSPKYAVFQRPFLQFHQLIDLTGAKHNHAVFQRPLPQGCRLS